MRALGYNSIFGKHFYFPAALWEVALAIIFSLSACGPASITFADPNLEATIRETIDKLDGAILTSDVEGLTSLIASERGIADLTGLEHCSNLTELNVTGSQISDIASLASLSNLLVLNLKGNQIGDVSPLASLANLDILNLEENPLSSTSLDVYIPQLEERGVKVTW